MWGRSFAGGTGGLRVAASVANDLGARLVAVHVLDWCAEVGSTAERVAASILYDEIPDSGAEPRGEVGDVAERLAAVAHEENAIMIVLGSRSRGRSRTLLRARCAAELSSSLSCRYSSPLDNWRDGEQRAPSTRSNPKEASMTALAIRSPVRRGRRAPVDAREGEKPSGAYHRRHRCVRGWVDAGDAAVRLAVELDALDSCSSYVRRGPAGLLAMPVFERRLNLGLWLKPVALFDHALGWRGTAPASRPRVRFLRARRASASSNSPAIGARGSIVVGSRRRKLGAVSRAVVRAARRPVWFTRPGQLDYGLVRLSPPTRARDSHAPRDRRASRRGVHTAGYSGRLVGALTVGASDELETVLKDLIADHAPTGALERELVAGRSRSNRVCISCRCSARASGSTISHAT